MKDMEICHRVYYHKSHQIASDLLILDNSLELYNH